MSHATIASKQNAGRHPVLRLAVATAGQLLLATAIATAVAAQAHTGAIHGRIIDATGRPLSGVDASLSSTALHATSDSAGGFLLGNIPPGRYALVLRLVGFDRLQFTANVFADDTIEGAMTMHASAVALDTVVTKATKGLSSQEAADFDAIRKTGMGVVFDSVEISSHAGDRVSDLLRYKLRGIMFKERSCGGQALAAGDGVGLPVDLKGAATISQGGCSAPDACYYQVYLDGMRVYSYDRHSVPPDIDRIVDMSTIGGIEVYGSGARTPAQYNGTGAACGTIVLWTKR